jgi:hypothetical protein
MDSDFFSRTPIAQEIIARIDQRNCSKLKNFCTVKGKKCDRRDRLQNGENLCYLFI